MVKEWDEREKIRYKEKILIQKGQLKTLIADCYTTRFLYEYIPALRKQIDDIRKVCEDAHEKLGLPENKTDRDILRLHIITELKKMGWKINA